MTRTIVYGGALVAFAGATAMTLAANLIPNWVEYAMYPTAVGSDPFWLNLGLHQSCASEGPRPLLGGGHCRHFPVRETDCSFDDLEGATPRPSFCTLWRSAGFVMEAALVVELVALLGFFFVLCGGDGRTKRHFGWRLLSPLTLAAAALQLAAMILVAHVVATDDRFLVPGWSLATSWNLCTASWVVALVAGAGLAASAWLLPPEDGYEFLRDPVTHSDS